jgi:hypothetical protein
MKKTGISSDCNPTIVPRYARCVFCGDKAVHWIEQHPVACHYICFDCIGTPFSAHSPLLKVPIVRTIG